MKGIATIGKFIELALEALGLEPEQVTDIEITPGMEHDYWVNLNDDRYFAWLCRKGEWYVSLSGDRECQCGDEHCLFCMAELMSNA